MNCGYHDMQQFNTNYSSNLTDTWYLWQYSWCLNPWNWQILALSEPGSQTAPLIISAICILMTSSCDINCSHLLCNCKLSWRLWSKLHFSNEKLRPDWKVCYVLECVALRDRGQKTSLDSLIEKRIILTCDVIISSQAWHKAPQH